MGGARTSQACRLCKQRRTKCDEKWPTCRTCKAARKVCSGPSSLIKFIEVDNNRSLDGPERPNSAKTQPESSSLPSAPRVMVRRGPLRAPSDGGNASFGVFRLEGPRPHPTTVADRVSARLANLLKYGEDTGVCMQMSYLPFLPQRLPQSDCLRDCTALFCTAWTDYKRGKPLNQLLATSLYPKAIRTLQRTINGSELYSVETLAAMTMFERTITLFSNGEAQNFESHRRGIEHVMLGKGSINAEDKLDVALAFKSQWELTFMALSGSESNVVRSLWKDAFQELGLMQLVVYVEELQCFAGEYHIINNSFTLLSSWTQEVRTIRMDPKGTVARKEALVKELCTHQELLKAAIDRVVARATSLGHMEELPDRSLLLGKSFSFASARLAQALAGIYAIRRVQLRLVFDLSTLDGAAPDAEAYEAYRDACASNWMFLPYAASLDPISAHYLSRLVLPSLEAAEKGEEFDQLANILWTTDQFQCKYPRDKERFRARIVSIAMKESGRS